MWWSLVGGGRKDTEERTCFMGFKTGIIEERGEPLTRKLGRIPRCQASDAQSRAIQISSLTHQLSICSSICRAGEKEI